MKKRLYALLLSGVLALSLTACAKQEAKPEAPVETPEANFPVAFCLGAQPASLDPKDYAIGDEATYLVNLCSGLVSYRPNDSGKVEITADLCDGFPAQETNEEGKPYYVFTLREALKWSDGSALTAADFVYSWNRAAGDADTPERELFSCIDGFGSGSLNLTASEDGRTLTVVLAKPTPRFFERLANPVFCPVPESAVTVDGWDRAPGQSVTSGAYTLSDFSDEGMTLTKNKYYWDAANTGPEELDFVFSEDADAILDGYLEGRYRVAAGLPAGVTAQLRESEGSALHVTGRMGNYCICFNMNDPALSDFTEPERADIRTALSLLIDRSAICENIAKLGQRPAASVVPAGMTDADGSDFASHNGVSGTGGGYYSVKAEDYASNCEQAVKLLRGVADSSGKFKVTKNGVCEGFPTLTYLTSESAGHVEIANEITESFQAHGIELKTSVLKLSEFLNARAKGDYSMARFSWTAAYDDPASFLTLWAAGAGSNCIGLGQDAHGTYSGYSATIGGEKVDGRTWAEAYDALIYTVQGSTDEALRSRCMHEAETLLMQSGAICPIYEYTGVYLCRDSFKGLFTGPAGALYFMRADANIKEGSTS